MDAVALCSKKNVELIILDYMVTSNHTHLLVYDDGNPDVIPKSVQLLAGRVGQEFNSRKKRKGAFWQDRYHSTAVETGENLRRCIVYIDLNMVRAGTINHPSEWCGYNEIQHPRRKNILISYDKLCELAGFETFDAFQAAHGKWIDDLLGSNAIKRESRWSESIATGSDKFAKNILSQMGLRIKGRKIVKKGQSFQVREEVESYNAFFDAEKRNIPLNNTQYWSVDA